MSKFDDRVSDVRVAASKHSEALVGAGAPTWVFGKVFGAHTEIADAAKLFDREPDFVRYQAAVSSAADGGESVRVAAHRKTAALASLQRGAVSRYRTRLEAFSVAATRLRAQGDSLIDRRLSVPAQSAETLVP